MRLKWQVGAGTKVAINLQVLFRFPSILLVVTLWLATPSLRADPECADLWMSFFKAQRKEELLSQHDPRLVAAGLEVQTGGVCGPVCIWNKLHIWKSALGADPSIDPIGAIERMVNTQERDIRLGTTPEEVSRTLLKLGEELPGKFVVEVISPEWDKIAPLPEGIIYRGKKPTARDLEGKYPSIVLLEVRSESQPIAYHWVLTQPHEEGTRGTQISDPERPNEMHTIDFGLRKSGVEPAMYAGRNSPYPTEVLDFVPVATITLKPSP